MTDAPKLDHLDRLDVNTVKARLTTVIKQAILAYSKDIGNPGWSVEVHEPSTNVLQVKLRDADAARSYYFKVQTSYSVA